jgi:hypothetical protein
MAQEFFYPVKLDEENFLRVSELIQHRVASRFLSQEIQRKFIKII